MGKRIFEVDFEARVTIELDDTVIDAVDDEWRKNMYPLHTPEQIAEHIAFNMVANHIQLESMDGWADQPNARARIVERPDWEMSAREVTPPKQTKVKRRRTA